MLHWFYPKPWVSLQLKESISVWCYSWSESWQITPPFTLRNWGISGYNARFSTKASWSIDSPPSLMVPWVWLLFPPHWDFFFQEIMSSRCFPSKSSQISLKSFSNPQKWAYGDTEEWAKHVISCEDTFWPGPKGTSTNYAHVRVSLANVNTPKTE